MLAVKHMARECPCCGGPGQVKTVNTPHSHGWVGCSTCGLYIQWNWDPHDALDKWNRRTSEREWIDADTPPERSGMYIVTLRDKRSTDACHMDKVRLRLWVADRHDWIDDPTDYPSTVIRWMPLPKLPAEGAT